MELNVSDLVDAVSELVKHGYDHEYRIKDGTIRELATGAPIATGDIHVDAAFRFESEPDAGDGSNVYAISDRATSEKGLLIDAFDTLDRDCSTELFELLSAERQTKWIAQPDVPSRYGLRKIYKSEFEQDTERFVLRIDFPDFPPCPFGHSFSVLGFDTAEQQYVWLVTSIMRDSRLTRIPYQEADILDNT